MKSASHTLMGALIFCAGACITLTSKEQPAWPALTVLCLFVVMLFAMYENANH
jgi:VIT1/CCC1 family predicted Fe2+/Mn2+ transporter